MDAAKQNTLATSLASGKPLRAIAELLGLSLTTVWRYAKRLNCQRRTHLTPAQVKNLKSMAADPSRSTAEIAAHFRVHPTTVRRHRPEVAEPERTELETPQRCGVCGGLVNVLPCVLCGDQ